MISFGSDMTLRWACRSGDYVFWARFQGVLSPPGNEYKVLDIWELRDGNSVTITNRRPYLPDWFDLHPLEVSGSLVGWMKKPLEQGLLQVDLAKKIGVNQMTIVNWEKGKTKPDQKKFEKLRAILGSSMPSDWIVKT